MAESAYLFLFVGGATTLAIVIMVIGLVHERAAAAKREDERLSSGIWDRRP